MEDMKHGSHINMNKNYRASFPFLGGSGIEVSKHKHLFLKEIQTLLTSLFPFSSVKEISLSEFVTSLSEFWSKSVIERTPKSE